MARRIVLLSDGTGNAAASFWRTNVWRIYEAIDLTDGKQIAFYLDGVGTNSFKPIAIIQSVFGLGLKRNVLELYRFLCRNYKSSEDYAAIGQNSNHDDEIFAFGFSRGAFTIRVLIGFVLDQGLVKYESEEELREKAAAAYRQHRAARYKTPYGFELPFRWLRNLFVPSRHNTDERPVKRIRFLGLWDTVGAYGAPIEEMTRGINRFFFPLELPTRLLHEAVDRACHALSIDDERTTFYPLLWDEAQECPAQADEHGVRQTAGERITQVWFMGVHSNVGGGYPDDSVAHIPMNWILAEAQACQLQFRQTRDIDADTLSGRKLAQGRDGRLYDSRHGFYRYGPRNIHDLCNMSLSSDPRDLVHIRNPKIHESVLDRIKNQTSLYAPITLPADYEVVTYDRRIVSVESVQYESEHNRIERLHRQRQIWCLVWRRKAVYFLTAFTALYLALYPLFRAQPPLALSENRFQLLTDAILFVGSFLPDALRLWVTTYSREPDWFFVTLVLIAFLMLIGRSLEGRVKSQMSRTWMAAMGRPHEPVRALRSGSIDRLINTAILLLVLSDFLAPLSHAWSSLAYYTSFPIKGILAVLLLVQFLPDASIAEIRERAAFRAITLAIKVRIAPAIFATIFLGCVTWAIFFALHLLAVIEDSAGFVCQGSATTAHAGNTCTFGKTDASGECFRIAFDISNRCQATGIFMQANSRYRIAVRSSNLPWRGFAGISFDPLHFEKAEPERNILEKGLLFVLVPLKRTYSRPWFTVIARVRSTGYDEDPLDPDEYGVGSRTTLTETIRPRRNGELFFYVNDGLLPSLLGRVPSFYSNNVGSADIEVTRLVPSQ